MSKPPSLREVAQHAGVSLGTASRALNNKSNVLPETRARVMKAATVLGYKVQVRAATPLSTKINTVGLAIKRDPGVNPKVDPFHYSILTGIEDECRNLGLNLMFTSIEVDEDSNAINKPVMMEGEEIDGLIIVGAVLNDLEIVESINPEIPVVLIDSYCPHKDFESVEIDNFRSAYRAVSYLIMNGHTQIGLIGSSGFAHEHNGVRSRRRAYQRALHDNDIPHEYIMNSRLNDDSAYGATLSLFDQHPEVTAIFSCNDEIVRSIYMALDEMNLRVPDDVSVVGFDNTEMSSLLDPQLTTVFVDTVLMGVLGVRQLYDLAANRDRVPLKTILQTRIIERSSVKQLSNRPLASPIGAPVVPDLERFE